MKEQSLRVSLPGTAYQRGQRWWWRVKLPGEAKARARALKPKGQKAATTNRRTAAKVAFELWEDALRQDAERQARIGADDKIAKLKAKFLQKMHDVSQVVDRLSDQDGSEVRDKVEDDVQPAGPTCGVEETGICGCCGTPEVPVAELQVIDSGQLLCPACLAQLKAAAQAGEVRDAEDVTQEGDQASWL